KRNLDQFVTRARKRDMHMEGREVTGFSFGRGALSGRVYNKALEVSRSGKLEISWQWGRPTVSVWRAEAQFRREALSRFRVETLADAVTQSQSLWDYWSKQWLSMRTGKNDNVSRRPLTRFWKRVRSVQFEFTEEFVVMEPVWFARPVLTDEQVVAQI